MDHQPVVVTTEEERVVERRKVERRMRDWRKVWDMEGWRGFRKVREGNSKGRKVKGKVQEEWERLERKVKRAVERVEEERKGERGRKRGYGMKSAKRRRGRLGEVYGKDKKQGVKSKGEEKNTKNYIIGKRKKRRRSGQERQKRQKQKDKCGKL